jgi:hypothetical protein
MFKIYTLKTGIHGGSPIQRRTLFTSNASEKCSVSELDAPVNAWKIGLNIINSKLGLKTINSKLGCRSKEPWQRHGSYACLKGRGEWGWGYVDVCAFLLACLVACFLTRCLAFRSHECHVVSHVAHHCPLQSEKKKEKSAQPLTNRKRDIVDSLFHASGAFGHNPTLGFTFSIHVGGEVKLTQVFIIGLYTPPHTKLELAHSKINQKLFDCSKIIRN